ncbi:MAG: substrate-binding domain-containing protein [Terriglobales bacterium]
MAPELNRRSFFCAGLGSVAMLAVGAAMAPLESARVQPLQVAYAGSMAAVMEGALRHAARDQGWDLHGRAAGATALAELIARNALRPDVFISITADPMQRILRAGRTTQAVAFARTAVTLSYDPHGRWAAPLQQRPWWQVAQEPGFRFGRSDPRTDPQGRNIIYTCRLAESYYRQPGLAHRILGEWTNPAQIYEESSLEARVQSGQLDAVAAYRFQPAAYGMAVVLLPDAINLASLPSAAAALSLNLDGRRYQPEPLVFYAAALVGVAHARAADAFVTWLGTPPTQAIFRQAGYQPAPGLPPITAMPHG